MNTKTLADFQTCISVPLSEILFSMVLAYVISIYVIRHSLYKSLYKFIVTILREDVKCSRH